MTKLTKEGVKDVIASLKRPKKRSMLTGELELRRCDRCPVQLRVPSDATGQRCATHEGV